jgi:hypothetical protein
MNPEGRPLILIPDTATDEEVAALTAVLHAVSGAARPAPEARTRSEWAAPRRSMRGPLRPGRGAWRTSGLPG